MKKVTKEVLHSAASRIMINMKEEEYETLIQEFETILKQMELISHIEGVDEATPMTFPFDVTHSFLREDEPINELSVKEGLRNAADVIDNQIKLPKVVK